MSNDEINNTWVILGAVILIGALGWVFFGSGTEDNSLSGTIVPLGNNLMADAPCHQMGGQWMGDCTLREIDLVAEQWDWSEPTITVRSGELVRLKVQSKDVVHGIAIPAANFNIFIEPGKISTGEFMAPEPGVYEYGCSVNCGEGHHNHKGKLIVI